METLAQKAVGMMKAQGLIRVVNHDLLDATLMEIDREYRSGLIRWLKEQPDRWRELLQLEATINQTCLSGDEVRLRVTLAAYKTFFEEMVLLYEKADVGLVMSP